MNQVKGFKTKVQKEEEKAKANKMSELSELSIAASNILSLSIRMGVLKMLSSR